MNNKILMILPLLISSPNCLIEVEEPTNVTSDFAQLANFSIGTDYSFLSSKKSISDKKYDADYIYKGSKDTTYRKTYSEQKGTFAILMNGISYFESSVSFTIDFGMYASSSLFTKDLPVPITLKLSYSGSLL